ncbi:MAG: ISNCY family transposase [Acidobacteriota bacterium]|nr:ISNCY family transposase [Acidobacteriota bacterium]
MSQEERDWLEWLKRARDGVITQQRAAEKMGITDRWVRKLLARMKDEGDAVVVHRLRGQASNRRIAEEIRAQATELLKQPEWHDFGPKFASEQLAKRHEIDVSKETARTWMIAAGLWKSNPRKLKEVHCWRARRRSAGELVQWDTSTHDWIEGRGEGVSYLVRLIDDATSRSWGRFVPHDGTRENMGVLWEYIERNGRPVEVYTDRHTMFAVPRRVGESEEQRREADRLTQMGRALRELGIGWIAAHSPQAKGRVERSFGTDQDRLVKLLRLAKIKDMTGANEFLEKEYWPEWNEKFAQPLSSVTDLHRPLTKEIELGASLSHVEQRVISNDYTFSFAGRRYQIDRRAVQAGMKRGNLRIELRLDGSLKARYEGHYIEVSECGEKIPATPAERSKPVSKDHNAGGKSRWMQGFFDRPSPALWQAVRESNGRG